MLSDPRVQHLQLELGHPNNSLSCGLVKFLKRYLLRLRSWCIGERGWGKEVAGGGKSSGLKNKTSWREERDAEVECRPKAVHGFPDSWERGGISFLLRVGNCKTSATLRPKTCDAPSPRRPLFESALRPNGPADRFLWEFMLCSGGGEGGTPRPTPCGDCLGEGTRKK